MDKDIKDIEKKVNEIYKIALANQKASTTNAKDIKDNFERINKNSFALDILKDYKRSAVIWRIAFFITLGLLILISIHHFIIK